MTRTARIVALPGDGIGPEVTDAALDVLDAVRGMLDLEVSVERHPIGWAAVEQYGSPLPEGTRAAAVASDAVFLGAVGDPRADGEPPARRPETGLLDLRKALDCFANLRPARAFEALIDASPVKADRIRAMDFLIVRELSSGLYYGTPRGIERDGDEAVAVNTLRYTSDEIRRVADVAFRAAAGRRGRVTSVDKANVLETSRLWREVTNAVAADYPDVELEHMLVDRAAMELVLRPDRFDVILTENMFGDILSDEAGAVTGSIGLLASASLGTGPGLYEPVHGSAPDIAGQGVANPLAAILSMAMLLTHSLDATAAADAIEHAVDRVLANGVRTADLAGPGEHVSNTREVTRRVIEALDVPD